MHCLLTDGCCKEHIFPAVVGVAALDDNKGEHDDGDFLQMNVELNAILPCRDFLIRRFDWAFNDAVVDFILPALAMTLTLADGKSMIALEGHKHNEE